MCDRCPIGRDAADSVVRCFRGVDVTGWVVAYEFGGVRVNIAPHFCFDGASIPQCVWSIIGHPFTPGFVRAALLHDVLYHSHVLSRRMADDALLELLAADGVTWWKRTVIWLAVRCFGWMFWKQPQEVIEYFSKFIRVEGTQE